jgi:uncharacterized protein
MKFALLLLVVFIAVLLWRSGRPGGQRRATEDESAKPKALSMLSCRQCGVHAPAQEMVQGQQGVYCCVAHRNEAER